MRGAPGNGRPYRYARHDQQLGGASPLWRLMAPTTSQRQLLLREEGGEEARGEIATLGTHGVAAAVAAVRCAYEAGRSGRAGRLRRSPMPSRGRHVDAVGARGRLLEVIRGDLHGCPRCPVRLVRGVVRDGGVREGVARRGEVSRRRSTSGDHRRWEGLNAKPSVKTLVLVAVALIAANPARGLAGRAGG